MSPVPSPPDTEGRTSMESMPTTAPSSTTSEPPPPYTGSPALKPTIPDSSPAPAKLKRELSLEEKLASREIEAPVPNDFPGKKPPRSAHIVAKGDFEASNHFYPRCCKYPSPFPVLCFSVGPERYHDVPAAPVFVNV